jgi:hypothetical protein
MVCMSQTEQIKPAALEQTADADKSVQGFSSAHLLAEFAKSAIQTGLITPLWNGAAGAISLGHLPQVSIVDSEAARTNSAEATAQTLGTVAGLAADAFLLSKLHGLLFRGGTAAAESAGLHLGEQKSFSRSLLSERSLSLLAKEPETLAGERRFPSVSEQSSAQDSPIARIKRHIADEASPGAQYIARVIKENDVTVVGEFHNKKVPSLHRQLGVEALSELPAGSILAVEFPASFRPIFEEFNAAEPGSDFNLSSPLAKSLNDPKALEFLRVMPHDNPEILDLWKSVRDGGSRVIPIDSNFDTYGGKFTALSREKMLADQVVALHRENVGKPVVAWAGNYHAAYTNVHDVPSFAQQIAQASEFVSGRSKLSTIYSQIAEIETMSQPLYAVAKDLSEPLAFPTFRSKPVAEQPFANVSVVSPSQAGENGINVKLGDYDHAVMYPPATSDQARPFFRKRFDNKHLVEDRIEEGT